MYNHQNYYQTAYVDQYTQQQQPQHGFGGYQLYQQPTRGYQTIDRDFYIQQFKTGIIQNARLLASNPSSNNSVNRFLLTHCNDPNLKELIEVAVVMALWLEYRYNYEGGSLDFDLRQNINPAYLYTIALLASTRPDLVKATQEVKNALSKTLSEFMAILETVRGIHGFDNKQTNVYQDNNATESFAVFGVDEKPVTAAPSINMMNRDSFIRAPVGNLPLPAVYDADGRVTTASATSSENIVTVNYQENKPTENKPSYKQDKTIGSNISVFSDLCAEIPTAEPTPVVKEQPVHKQPAVNDVTMGSYFEVVENEGTRVELNHSADIATISPAPVKPAMPRGYAYTVEQDDLEALELLGSGQLTREALAENGFVDAGSPSRHRMEAGIDYPIHMSEEDVATIHETSRESFGEIDPSIDFADEFDPDAVATPMLKPPTAFMKLNTDHAKLVEDVFNNHEEVVQQIEAESPALAKLSKEEQSKLLAEQIAPVYLIGRTELYVCELGDKKLIRSRKVREPVKYHEHETEMIASLAEDFQSTSSPALAEESLVKALGLKSVDTYLDEIRDLQRKDEIAQIETIFMNTPAIRIPMLVKASGVADDYSCEPLVILTREFGKSIENYDIEDMIINYDRIISANFFLDEVSVDHLQNALATVQAEYITDYIREFMNSVPLCMREKNRLLNTVLDVTNRWIKMVINPSWKISNFLDDATELAYEVEEAGMDVEIVDKIYAAAVKEVFGIYDRQTLLEADIINDTDDIFTACNLVATIDNITLVPFTYADYPIAVKGKYGVVTREALPKLYEVLSSYMAENPHISKYLMVTKDNVVFTFCKSVVGDEIFIINQ